MIANFMLYWYTAYSMFINNIFCVFMLKLSNIHTNKQTNKQAHTRTHTHNIILPVQGQL